MQVLIDIYFMASILFGLVMMAAMSASLGNIFRKEKEDNILFRFVIYIPKKVLEVIGLGVSDFSIFICSYLMAGIVVFGNVLIIFTLE